MAMAYGPILVCGDYKGDLDGIIGVLNQWEWDSDVDLKFVVSEGWIHPNAERFSYPSAHPYHPSSENGDRETVELATIVEQICPFLESGTLELVALSEERARSGYMGRLIIRADGSGESHEHFFDNGTTENWSRHSVFEYDSKTASKK
jgi:hypothetical protein